jgi:spore coat protein U-like protein
MHSETGSRRSIVLVTTALIGLCHFAAAESLQTTMQVAATVVAGCHELRANPLVFGPYPQGNATAVDSSTTVRVNCTQGVPFIVSAEQDSAENIRRMTSSSPNQSGMLEYNLYRSGTFQQIWGSANNGNAIVGVGTGSETPQQLTIYGRILPGQMPPLGSYSDTVIVTLSF